MKGGFLEEAGSTLWIVSLIGAVILVVYLIFKYNLIKKPEVPVDPPKVEPQPHHHRHGWGPGPWGPDPYDPDYNPVIPPAPAPTPVPAPDNFKPELNLLKARYDPVSRYIQVDYKVMPSGSVPPTKTFNIAFDVLVKGSKTADFPEEEPLTSSEMSGLQQQSLVPVTNAPVDVKAADLTVSAQIQYRENGTTNMGVTGIPVTINVM
jgi:hypothetical protein